MIDLPKLSRKPLKLHPTRVWRTYTGGKLIDEWHGYETPVDSSYPEEWVSSLVTAYNPDSGPQSYNGPRKLDKKTEPVKLQCDYGTHTQAVSTDP